MTLVGFIAKVTGTKKTRVLRVEEVALAISTYSMEL